MSVKWGEPDFSGIDWQYGDKDPEALAELRELIERAGSELRLITFSELAEGVIFRLPNLMEGDPYWVRTDSWSGLDRRVIGDFLGHMCALDYPKVGFMPSALVVSGSEFSPSPIFFDWVVALGILPNQREETVLAYWAEQVNRAHKWYSARANS